MREPWLIPQPQAQFGIGVDGRFLVIDGDLANNTVWKGSWMTRGPPIARTTARREATIIRLTWRSSRETAGWLTPRRAASSVWGSFLSARSSRHVTSRGGCVFAGAKEIDDPSRGIVHVAEDFVRLFPVAVSSGDDTPKCPFSDHWTARKLFAVGKMSRIRRPLWGRGRPEQSSLASGKAS